MDLFINIVVIFMGIIFVIFNKQMTDQSIEFHEKYFKQHLNRTFMRIFNYIGAIIFIIVPIIMSIVSLTD